MNRVELLAPAGDLERLKWACLYGADAIYLGGENYSLRSNAKNFTLDEIKEGVEYAHKRNVKVYVTVNIVFHENDDEKSSSSKPKYKAPIINDPENVVIRFNGNTQKIELYNQVSQKTIESIKANDFVSMINKLDNNSGILVNKKI